MINKIFIASGNAGKLAEFVGLAVSGEMPSLRLELALLSGFAALPEFDESAGTFAEIAAGKALHYSRFTDEAVLADDSGLVVAALGGEPGVRSARYAGPDASSAERNEKLLGEMRGFIGEQRRAYFVCALGLAQRGRAMAIITARADGEILPAPRGVNGFGYDPVFYVRALGKSFAELLPEEKNRFSHRGKAFRRLLQVFPRI
jgi:non-canonical purine NTP pyrophosphatase (RdgB/HAM1 family)